MMAKEDIVKHQFTSDQSRTKAAKNGRKGGIASGEAKRERKDMRYFAKIVLDELVKDKKSGAELPTRYAALKSVLKKVLKEGDHNALKTLAQLAGELPKDAGSDVVINVNYNGVTKEAQDALDDL
jgi:hypothetical protein